jgi:Ca2+/Na+ antiporter
LPGLITPLAIPGDVITFSLSFFLGVTLLYVLVTVDARINRFEAAQLMLFYVYFIGHLYHLT